MYVGLWTHLVRNITVFDTQGGVYDKLSDYQLLKKSSVRHIVVTIITIFHITHTVNTFGLQYVKQSEEQTMSGKIQYKIIKRCFWRQGKGTWLRYFNPHFKNRWRSSKVVRVQELVTICLALPSPNAESCSILLFHSAVLLSVWNTAPARSIILFSFWFLRRMKLVQYMN